MKSIIILILSLLPILALADTPDSITGTWLTEDHSGKIQIYRCGQKYCGKTVWIRPTAEDPKPEEKRDIYNPDPKKRDRLLIGTTIMWGLVYDPDDKEWRDGSIYDTRSGKLYSCKAKLESGKVLLLRGFLGISLLGQTTRWTKVS